MFKRIEVIPLPGFLLHLRYEDGVEGEVDLSPLCGKGVFSLWDEPGAFDGVSIGHHGAIRWSDEVELCPDALYFELTGTSPEDAFPNFAGADANAGD